MQMIQLSTIQLVGWSPYVTKYICGSEGRGEPGYHNDDDNWWNVDDVNLFIVVPIDRTP